jgi:hypothetical protein
MKNKGEFQCMWKLLVLGFISLLSGCANSTHMFMAQETNLGLVGSVSPQTGNVKVDIGYHRWLATVIPKVNNIQPDGTENEVAGSVFIASHGGFHYLDIPEISDLVATGTAANNLASTGEGKVLFSGPTPTPTPTPPGH